MYGYFDVKNVYLKNDERSVFMSYYCRLCYSLWARGGQKARYLTTYDAAVYNLVLALAGADKRPPIFPCQQVRLENRRYFEKDPNAGFLADSVILAFAVKINDDCDDGDKGRAFVCRTLFGRMIKRVVKKNAELYEKSVKAIRNMDELQRGGADLKTVLEAYGKAVSCAFTYAYDMEEKYVRTIELIAQWTFFIDMLDDYDDDVKKGAVNTLVRDGCATRAELFDKHYNELIPVIADLENELNNAVNAIKSEEAEWVVLHKIIGHSLATLVPAILNGKDVRFHYFKDTYMGRKKVAEGKRIIRKFTRK